MKKTIKCPRCGYSMTAEGSPGEIKHLVCPNCGSKGRFVFPVSGDFGVPEERMPRPLGVTILAALQIIGLISAIFSLMLVSGISGKFANLVEEIAGFPLIVFLAIYSMVLVPVSIVLAYGLLKGEEWARLASVWLQIAAVISSIMSFNLFGLIIPLIVIYYLRRPYVKRYFESERSIRISTKAVIAAVVVVMLLMNGYVALMINPLHIYTRINKVSNERYYYGIWGNETQDIEIIFYRNDSFFIENSTDSYWGKWSTGSFPFILKLKWAEGTGEYTAFFTGGGTTIDLEKSKGPSGFFSSIELKKKSEV